MTDALADELERLSESDRLIILDGLAARLERVSRGTPKHWEHHLLIEAACLRAILSALREREEPVKPSPKGGVAVVPVELRRGFLDSEPTEAMIEAGLEFNHRHNSAENMIASFKAMLAQAEIDGLIYASQQTNPREEPCAECAAVSAAIGGPDFMDPPDGGDVPLSEQVRRMRAALREREPVAWRWRKLGTEGPWFTGTSPVEGPGAADFYEVQPLYTAPTHQEEQL